MKSLLSFLLLTLGVSYSAAHAQVSEYTCKQVKQTYAIRGGVKDEAKVFEQLPEAKVRMGRALISEDVSMTFDFPLSALDKVMVIEIPDGYGVKSTFIAKLNSFEKSISKKFKTASALQTSVATWKEILATPSILSTDKVGEIRVVHMVIPMINSGLQVTEYQLLCDKL